MVLNVNVSFPETGISDLRVRRYEMVSALSALFELTIEVFTTDPAIEMKQVVGASVQVSLPDEPLVPEVRGIVRRVRQLSAVPEGASSYELSIVPPLWLTTLRRDHRIFQDQSVPEIVNAVTEVYAGRVDPPLASLGGEHPKREYCVQYGESDHDFVFRILADEGVTAFFDHEDESALRIFDDTTGVLGPGTEVPFVPPSGVGQNVGVHIARIEIATKLESSVALLRDYDFLKPEFVLESSALEEPLFSNEGALPVYEYGVGEFSVDRDGVTLAQRRLEEARALRRVRRCEASFAVSPGMHLVITGHPRDDVNGRVLVVRAHSTVDTGGPAGQRRARNIFECISAKRPFRPPRRPKPRIFGTQTAMVIGATRGEEIDVDEHGRVMVRFRWDRRDPVTGSPTRRIRVSQGWAGPGSGFVMLPRVGDEVIVSYLDGDPDEPIIVGRVHNGTTTSPLNLPADKTRSIWRSRSSPGGDGFNEIMMEDRAGSEQIHVRAQRDLVEEVRASHSTSVGGDQSNTVGGRQIIDVKGSSRLAMISGDDIVVVEGTRFVSAGAGEEHTIRGNHTHAVDGGNYQSDVSGNNQFKSSNTYFDCGDFQVNGKTTSIWASGQIVAKGGGAQLTLCAGIAILDNGAGAGIALIGGQVFIWGSNVSTSASGGASTTSNGYVITSSGAISIAAGGDINASGATIKLNG